MNRTSQPSISIITVCFNSVKTISTCIDSIQNQTYSNLEHVVIDGNSTDGTQEIVKNTNPIYFISEPDNGIYHAMNKGLEQAKGEYCLFLNADDFFKDNKVIENMISQVEDHDLICAGVDIYKENKLFRKYKASNFKPWMFKFGHQPPHPGFLCKTELLRATGGFNQNYKIAGDFDLMLRVFDHPKLKWRTLNLVAVNMQHGGASSGSFEKKQLMNKEIKSSLKQNNKTAQGLSIWMKYLFKVFQIRF